MSFHIKREDIDKENTHVALGSKDQTQARAKSSEMGGLPQKRPLVTKAVIDKRARRVPLGGKDQNLVQSLPFASLQRSQSSLTQKLPYRAPQLPTSWQPTLGRSNSSLGFSHTKAALNSGRNNESGLEAPKPTRKTNPLKNDLLSADNAARCKALVPRFSADSLEKPQTRQLGATSTLQALAAPQLHASNIPPPQRTKEPAKKSAVTMDDVIEALAEDESSIEIVPGQSAPLRDVPVGLSPLGGPKFRFLEPEASTKKLSAAIFDSSVEMSLDDIFDEKQSPRIDMMGEGESTRIDASAEAEIAADLHSAGPLGLSEQELNDLLDY